jgi:hypothetical protein
VSGAGGMTPFTRAVGAFATRTEGELVQGMLASAGIESSIAADDAGGALPLPLSGGVHVLVREGDFQAASDLVQRSG